MTDASYVFGYGITQTMAQVLRQCKGDFSRANVMQQAENLRDSRIVRCCCRGSSSAPATMIIGRSRQMQMQRWDGKTWEWFGGLMGNTV